MKKFTTLAMALAVGGFAANAALSEPTIDPVDGSLLPGWPAAITLEWDGIVELGDNLTVQVSYNGGAAQNIAITEEDLYVGGEFDDEDNYIPTGPSVLTINWDEIALVEWVPQVGTYAFSIPAGVVKDSEGNVSSAYSLTYNLIAVKGWQTVEPDINEWDDNGNPVTFMASELSALTFGFTDPYEEDAPVYELEAVVPAPAVKVTLVDEEEGGIGGWMPFAVDEDGVLNPELIKVEGDNIILDLSGLGNGKWSIEVPAGFAKFKGLNDTYTNSIEATVEIKNDLGEAEVVGGLENYLTYTALNAPEYAIVTWDYENIELSGEGDVVVNIYNPSTYEQEDITIPATAVVLRYISQGEGDNNPDSDGPGQDQPVYPGDEDELLTRADAEVYNALEINFGEQLAGKTGNFTVTIPEGFVTNGKLSNPVFEFYFDVKAVYDQEPAIENIDGEVEFTWVGVGVYVNAYDSEPAYVTGNGGAVVAELTYASPWDDEVENPDVTELVEDVEVGEDIYPDFVGVIVNLNNLELEDGDYTLWLPLGYLTIHTFDYSEDWLSNVISWPFTVTDGVIEGESTAIEAIAPAQTVVGGVYNLQGVKVAEGVDGLSNLAKGIYIINGKKVLVK